MWSGFTLRLVLLFCRPAAEQELVGLAGCRPECATAARAKGRTPSVSYVPLWLRVRSSASPVGPGGLSLIRCKYGQGPRRQVTGRATQSCVRCVSIVGGQVCGGNKTWTENALGEEDQMAVLPQTGAGDPREGYRPPKSTEPTRPPAWTNKQLQKKVWRT